ncbi:MAG TPA: PAS domain-containing protein [Chitinophagaceae bacterium]|nr:PAS domain-containing protein [Chitinophagaceae bacterium]
MKKVLKNISSNWFVFFGYLSLFLLTVIAALQIYDANYKITGKYKELANIASIKLSLLLNTRENLEAIQTITDEKQFHSTAMTAQDELKFVQLVKENNNNLTRYQQFAERGNETVEFKKLQEAWELNSQNCKVFLGLQSSQGQENLYYRSIKQKSYENLQGAISSISVVLSKEIEVKRTEADSYFKESISFINILIGIRVAILIIIGIIIFNGVVRLRIKNKVLQETQIKLLQNQAHLLASQHISKTGSWELNLAEADSENALTWSDETYRIFGYNPGEVKVTNNLFFSHVLEPDQALITNAMQKSVETGIPYDIEHRIVLRSGEIKIIYERSDIFYDSNGKPETMVGTCQDITERKLAEQKLAESEKEKHQLTDEINKQIINRQKEITKATIIAQERERLELGRELHDNVNQILSSSKLFIESAMLNPSKQEEMLGRSKNLINTCIEELRKLSRYLTPPSLGDLTLKESIEEIIEEYNQIDGKKTIEYSITNLNEDILSEDLKISVYRIIQEQLNNIRKHAAASKIQVNLKHSNNKITLFISDNGRGFDLQVKRKGLGITNIINRAETFNGGVEIISSPGQGCSMFIDFKLNSASVLSICNGEGESEQKFYGTGS